MSEIAKQPTASNAAALALPAGVTSLTEIPISGPAPQGLRPLGRDVTITGIDPSRIPQTTAELDELTSFTYDLSASRAGELNIPVAGSVGGSFNRRVVVYEWTRFKRLEDSEGVEHRYGYVIRFCLTVNKWDAQGKLTLPFLSAQAEIGNIQASWLMQVRGLVGPMIDAVVLPPRELDVETFVIAKQSLDSVITAINDPSTSFSPGVLLATVDPSAPETDYRQAAIKAFATFNLSRGRSLDRTLARLGSTDPVANDEIADVFAFFGISAPNEAPSNEARQRARLLLGGIKADV